MIIAIAGASGFVGRALTAHLLDSGHDVVALGRSVGAISTDARAIAVDVGDEEAAATALVGVEVAYYLVHSMAAGGGFREVDLRLATAFGRAAARVGVGRIIYVGALGDAPSSAHLASRHEVGSALAAAGVAVIELRAAVVFGSGSISFEMLRYLTERLPAMVCRGGYALGSSPLRSMTCSPTWSSHSTSPPASTRSAALTSRHTAK